MCVHTHTLILQEHLLHTFIQSVRKMAQWELKDIIPFCNTIRHATAVQREHLKCSSGSRAWRRNLRRIWRSTKKHVTWRSRRKWKIYDRDESSFLPNSTTITLEEETGLYVTHQHARSLFLQAGWFYPWWRKFNCTWTIFYSYKRNYVILLSLSCKIFYPPNKYYFSQ